MQNVPDIQALPSVRFDDRKALPSLPAIYFAIDGDGRVLYIGKAVRLSQRWVGQSHHRHKQLVGVPGVRIAWLTVDDPALLDSIEEACIAHFSPALNGTPAEQSNRTRQITVTLYPLVWAELERRRAAARAAGAEPRGLDSIVMNEWLLSTMGVQRTAPPPPPPASDDDDDIAIVLPSQASE
jgi:hypothetical protein